ncbi:hypothetical protein H920_10903 [Fukomys damarensis]|uniref:Uncharacterized protein n=1 Tax=Fukomys damarensis TaxID=885580 RepID=A0A091DB90_FUKDA|nr:hypothetical protein H920_10903 [Fukomys damarensis]
MSRTCRSQESAPGRPRGQWWKVESLYWWGEVEGSAMEPGSDAQGEDQRSPAAIPRDSEDHSSSDDKENN